MSNLKKNYATTLKNTSILGSGQLISILISIIKGKVISVLLGPIGIGISSLLSTTLDLVKVVSSMGMEMSTIRSISEAQEEAQNENLDRIATISSKIFFWLGLLGGAITMLLSSKLSQLSFGDDSYSWAFVLLSVSVFLTTLTSGEEAKLKGFQKIGFVVKVGIYTSVLSLLSAIPIYYFFGIKGIVPVLLLSSIFAFIVTKFYSLKLRLSKVNISVKSVFQEGGEMIKMGVVLVTATFLGSLTKYGINIGIGYLGSLEDLGYYNAALSISARFVGFLLTAIGIDFFPRLVRVQKDSIKLNKLVNEQIEIILLLVTPLLTLMIFLAPLLVQLFLSAEFLVITDFIRYVALGAFFQVISSNLGYISFAKNDKSFYLRLEGVFSNILNFSLSMVFYSYFGVVGLGISFLVVYVIYYMIIIFYSYTRYKFSFTTNSIKLTVVMLLFLLISFLVTYIEISLIRYIIGGIILLICSYYSFLQLDKLTGVRQVVGDKVSEFLNRKK